MKVSDEPLVRAAYEYDCAPAKHSSTLEMERYHSRMAKYLDQKIVRTYLEVRRSGAQIHAAVQDLPKGRYNSTGRND